MKAALGAVGLLASLLPALGQGSISFATNIVANLSGAAELPPNDSAYAATALFSYNLFGYNPANDREVNCFIILPLALSPTSAGVYGPAEAAATGPLVFDLGQYTAVTNVSYGTNFFVIETWPPVPPPPVSNLPLSTNVSLIYSNRLTLTPQQMEQFNAGLWYVNVSSLTYPAGEIRGQINAPPYQPLQATYSGLFAAPTNVAVAASGSITLTTTTERNFSGSLRLGPARYAFSGTFDASGHARVTATSGEREPLVLNVVMVGTEKLVGSLRGPEWMAEVAAYRAAFDGRSSPATNYLGKYTLLLSPNGQPDAPGGYGFAALRVSAAGRVAIKGCLADGTAFSQNVPLSRDGHFALYAPLYTNGGLVCGWMACTNQSGAELEGSLLWLKPESGTALFPGGFASPVVATGGRYMGSTGGAGVLSATHSFVFGGDSSTLSFTNTLVMKGGYKLLNTSTNQLHVGLRLSSGTFSGSAKPPGSARRIRFKGAFWQNCGFGYFLDAGQSGWVLLQP
jgi:hypothetical protein